MPVRSDRTMVTIAEARAILAGSGVPVARTETVRLIELAGRTLAEDITAHTDVPPFSRAVMDGYAVLAADTREAREDAPVVLTLVDSIYTGDAPGHVLHSGACIGVATGAPLPQGADAVVMIEQTVLEGSAVRIRVPARAGQNIGARGSDIRAGQGVLAGDTLLTPARLGVVAALGLTHATVYARPRVAILCTGSEVVEPGRPLSSGQIYDVNSATLAAVVREHGGEPVPYPPVADDRAGIAKAFDAALAAADMVLVAGGSSVGERDYILEVIEARGIVRFQGIAIKPGKPTIFGIVDGRPVFGMPGNPTSCLSNAYLLVAPLLRTIARLPARPDVAIRARLARAVTSTAARHQFYPVRLEGDDAVPAFKGSGDITSLAGADGYFEIPVGVERVEEGTLVDVKRF